MIVKIKKDIEFTGIWWHFYSGSDIFFEVEDDEDKDWYIITKGYNKDFVLLKQDCEIVSEVTSVIPVLNEYQEPDYQAIISELNTKNMELQAELIELKKQLHKFKIGQEM